RSADADRRRRPRPAGRARAGAPARPGPRRPGRAQQGDRDVSIHDEVASQPACWRRAATMKVEGLPARGERVAVTGCGTGLYIGQTYAALREAAGHGETDAFAASEFPLGRSYDRVVAISRSGTTTEVLDLLERVDAPTVTISGETLPFADEASVVQTRFATT